jgi:hypothetical protein
MKMDRNDRMRGMSGSAPAYALLILLGMAGGFVIFVWGLCRVLF